MHHPDKPATYSRAPAGELAEKPEEVISFVTTDEDDESNGILERWSGDAWFYADDDALIDLN